MKASRRQFIRRGALVVPMAFGIFVPKLLLAGPPFATNPKSPYRVALKNAAAAGGGGSTELFNDNFNRADETPLGGNWTGQTGEGENFKLATNAVNPITDGDCGAYRNNVTWPADQYMEADCTAVAAGNGIGIALRMATGSKILYRVIIDSAGTINVEKLVPGYTLITTRSVTYSAGAKLRAEIAGSTIKVFYQGVQQGANISDSAIASGSGGICYSSSNGVGCKIDNAAGGSIP